LIRNNDVVDFTTGLGVTIILNLSNKSRCGQVLLDPTRGDLFDPKVNNWGPLFT